MAVVMNLLSLLPKYIAIKSCLLRHNHSVWKHCPENFHLRLITKVDNVLFGFPCTVFTDNMPLCGYNRSGGETRSIKLVHVCCLRVHKLVCVYFATMTMVLLLTSTIHILQFSNIFLHTIANHCCFVILS